MPSILFLFFSRSLNFMFFFERRLFQFARFWALPPMNIVETRRVVRRYKGYRFGAYTPVIGSSLRSATLALVRSRTQLSNFFLITGFRRNFLDFHLDVIHRSSYFFFDFVRRHRARPGFRRRSPVVWVSGVSSYKLIRPRASLRFMLSRNFLYQRRLTVFLATLKTFRASDFWAWLGCTLSDVLFQSSLFVSRTASSYFLNAGYVALNGVVCREGVQLLNFWDFIAVRVNLFIYSVLLAEGFKFRAHRAKILSFYFKYRARSGRMFPKLKSFRIPNWIFRREYFVYMPSFFLEVDAWSFSVIVLQLFFLRNSYMFRDYYRAMPVFNMQALNWKYVN